MLFVIVVLEFLLVVVMDLVNFGLMISVVNVVVSILIIGVLVVGVDDVLVVIVVFFGVYVQVYQMISVQVVMFYVQFVQILSVGVGVYVNVEVVNVQQSLLNVINVFIQVLLGCLLIGDGVDGMVFG